MKISTNINANNTIFAKDSNLNSSKNHGSLKSALSTFEDKKHDTFTMAGIDISKTDNKLSYNETFKSKNSELIRNLGNLSEKDKQTVAVDSYYQMQHNLKLAVDSHKERIDFFGELKEKKDYYNQLLAGDEEIDELGGKYAFLGRKAGETINKDDIYAALDEVQRDINSLMQPRTYGSESADKFFRNFGAKVFSAFAATFETVTGITDASLTVDGDESMMDQISGLTEENFVQKHTEAIEKIEKRSKNLENVMEKYMNGKSYAKELFENPIKAKQNKPQIYVDFENEFERLKKMNKMLMLQLR